MNRKLKFVFLVTIGLLSFAMGYSLITGVPPGSSPVAARSSQMPANPHILYLASKNIQRGQVNTSLMESRGATSITSWQEVHSAAGKRAVDALIVDANMFEVMTEADETWLHAQMREGIVIVGLGTELDQMARPLGLDTLRNPNEGDTPIGPTGYVMFKSQIIGQPEDVQKMETSNWLNRSIIGEAEPVPSIKKPLASSVGRARGNLSSSTDIEVFFLRLTSKIESLYRTRADYQESVQEQQQ